MGIRVERVIEIAFALSGLLAGIAGILVAPLFTISSTMGTLFGIKAFAVAILGGIESAWGVVLAGLIYGVAEALITALSGLDLHADRHLRARHSRARIAAERSVRPRRVEESMSWRVPLRPRLVIAAVCFLIARGNSYQIFIIVTVGLTAIVGIGLNVLLGLNGQISLGHVAFYAIGAYAVGILTTAHDWSFWPALAVGGAGRRIGRRAAGYSGAAGARSLSRHGDHRLRLRRRAGRRRMAGPDRRLERALRHSGPGRVRRRHRREGHRVSHRRADRIVARRLCATERQPVGQCDARGAGFGIRQHLDRPRSDLDPHDGVRHLGRRSPGLPAASTPRSAISSARNRFPSSSRSCSCSSSCSAAPIECSVR